MPDPGEPEAAGEPYVWRGRLTEVADLFRLAQLAKTLFGLHAVLEMSSGARLVVRSPVAGEPLAAVEFEANGWPGDRWVIRPVGEGEDGPDGRS